MATATIPVDDFEKGRLPRVCPISGEPTTRQEPNFAENEIGWLWILLLFGILPFLIARAIMKRTVHGVLPISESGFNARKARRRKQWMWVGVACLGTCLGVILIAVASVQSTAIIGLVVFVIGFVAARMVLPRASRSSSTRGGRSVTIRGAAPEFARAIGNQDRVAVS